MKTLFAAFALAAVAISPSFAQTFSNPANIAVVDKGTTTSTIAVSGTTGTITGMSLTLNGLSHSYPDDLVIGLTNKSLGLGFVFLSHVGGSIDALDATLAFSDAAGALLPGTGSVIRIVSGSYAPSNFGGYTYFDVADAGSFAGFNGFSANGDWALVVDDIARGDGGNIARGWSLSFTTAAGVPEPAAWGMMIGGFGLAGGALRRRRKVAPAYTA
ncbi:MAG: PEPxxWA-CTERM sorting domain-containing protein [Sphingomonas sp.]